MNQVDNKSRIKNVFLWASQGFLAIIFIGTGIMKLFQPEQLPYPWIRDYPFLVSITGIIDLLGGVGIIAPLLLRIQPRLIFYAAIGIISFMVSAIFFHILRGETKDIGFNIFVICLAVFIIWGRHSVKHKSRNRFG